MNSLLRRTFFDHLNANRDERSERVAGLQNITGMNDPAAPPGRC